MQFAEGKRSDFWMSIEENRFARIGFFGGSFDPVHSGHLIVAQDALEQMELDRIIFVPTATSPLKEKEAEVKAKERLSLLQLASDGNDRFEVSDMEITRGGMSYTIDTVSLLKAKYPQSHLFWIIGADQAVRLGEWHRIEDLIQEVEFIVHTRPSVVWERDESWTKNRVHEIESHAFDISSSEIRKRIRTGRSLRYLVPDAVLEAIKEKKLYQ
jgi:nicotinate-nucleotide adenylyltransferase